MYIYIAHIVKLTFNAHFISNFIAMATRESQGKILFAAFDGPTPKIPLWRQRSGRYLLQNLGYSPCCSKFCCHGNHGGDGVNINDTVRLAVLKNHTVKPKIMILSYTQLEL